MSVKGIFVVGTDTGVGKTIATGLLAGFLAGKGYKVVSQKWVETGSAGFSKDVVCHLKLLGKKKKDLKKHLSEMSPYTFKFPASPHLAAALEGEKISIEKIKNSFKSLEKDFDFVIVEGTGGALVPLTQEKLIIDVAKELGLAALVVAGNKLGAVNHALLTLEALESRKIRIAGAIFNQLKGKTDSIILKNNPKTVETITGQSISGILPWAKDMNSLRKSFKKIGENILAELKYE